MDLIFATLVLFEVAVIVPLPLRFTVKVAVLALLFSTMELGELVTLFAALPIVHDAVLPPVLPSDHL